MKHFFFRFYLQDREGDEERAHQLVPSPNACNSSDWAVLKPGAGAHHHLGLPSGWQDPSYSSLSCCLPWSVLAGRWSQESELGVRPRPSHLGCGHLNCQARCPPGLLCALCLKTTPANAEADFSRPSKFSVAILCPSSSLFTEERKRAGGKGIP